MKQLITTVITLSFLSLSLPVSAKVNVFTCEPEWKALVDELGGDLVNAYSATTAFQDPHYIEARPSLIAKTRRADLLVCTGAELEVGWLPLLLRKSGNADIQTDEPGYFMAAEQIDLIEIPTELDRSHGDVHASGNPHVHWDPFRLLTIAKALSERLEMIDGDNAAHYQRNFLDFEKKWKQQIRSWETLTAPLKGKKAIVHHKSWNYLSNWLGIEIVGDLEPKPGLPPTSKHLSSLLQKVRNTGADFILIANYKDDKGARWLSKKSDIPVLNLPYTVGGNESAKDLVSLYSDVLMTLSKNTH